MVWMSVPQLLNIIKSELDCRPGDAQLLKSTCLWAHLTHHFWKVLDHLSTSNPLIGHCGVHVVATAAIGAFPFPKEVEAGLGLVGGVGQFIIAT